MAKQNSERVMKQRKRDNDRISFVIDKDAKYLFRAQALREGVTMAEMIRRAVLARCGLKKTPNFATPHYSRIVNANDQESARKAILGLQLDEYMQSLEHTRPDNILLTVYLAGEHMRGEYIKALLDLLDAVEDAKADEQAPVKMSKKQIEIIRRLLANVEEIPEFPDD